MQIKVDGNKHFPTHKEEVRNSWLRPSGFAQTMKETEADRKKQVCERLLGKIDVLSAELKKKATPDGIKRYRDLIVNFMKEALNQSYSVGEEYHWDREGNRKAMVKVNQINQALEELMTDVMEKEKDHIDLVAKFDQIRGLLVDLYL